MTDCDASPVVVYPVIVSHLGTKFVITSQNSGETIFCHMKIITTMIMVMQQFEIRKNLLRKKRDFVIVLLLRFAQQQHNNNYSFSYLELLNR